MPKAVSIDFQQLCDYNSDLSTLLEEAYGPDGLGILTVSGVPGYVKLRSDMLTCIDDLAKLHTDILAKYENAMSHYNIGWSHGKEQLKDGTPDTLKGSFYANPVCDDPLPVHEPEAQELRCEHPAYFTPNIWPSEVPGFENAFKALGRLIVEVGMMLARHCDRYVMGQESNIDRSTSSLTNILKRGRVHKARALHYFPPSSSCNKHMASEGEVEHDSAWCGWHTDHGSLTGLTCAMYMADGVEVSNPDPNSGLYIRNRKGEVVQVSIPPTHIAFQVGEAMQVHSGGVLRATPHYVRAPSSPAAAGVARNTLAVFMQPDVFEPMNMPQGADEAQVEVGQWQRGQTFGEFTKVTLQKYYGSM